MRGLLETETELLGDHQEIVVVAFEVRGDGVQGLEESGADLRQALGLRGVVGLNVVHVVGGVR